MSAEDRPTKAARPDDATSTAALATPMVASAAVPGIKVRHSANPVVFFDATIAGQALPRITMELFAHVAPKTAENFRQLCTGEATMAGRQGPPGYKGAPFHRVVPGFVVQGGDFLSRDGRGSWSIYGDTFADEGFDLQHTEAGLLSMANTGPDSNGCQFFTTLAALPELDGKHVVFGRVAAGMASVEAIAAVPVVSATDRPSMEIAVAECGEL